MRLLEYNSDGDIVLTKDLKDNGSLPEYAILSHTWEDQEVTFEDLGDGTGPSKLGYRKIKYCGQQAKADGLQYFWVDTCCINKSNKAEFQHALKSMFRWYQDAVHCYVYLSDVSVAKRVGSDEKAELTWEPAFRDSRWFTRGWTLQELLAPSSVTFFSEEWATLGQRGMLLQQIHEITAIPLKALQGTPITEYSVEERLQWRRDRVTQYEEDGAYSLLGIFGVDLAPIYGEGTKEAFRRLREEISKHNQCLRDLYLNDPRDDKRRLEETKGGLLEDASHWILNNSEYQEWHDGQRDRLLWIRGDPGKGKTMLLCSIANKLKESTFQTDVLSYFFCQATDSRISNATAVLRGLLYLILEQQPSLTFHLRKKYDRAGRSMFEDANAWVSLTDAFTSVLADPLLNKTYLLLDALDECTEGLPKLLEFIVQSSSLSSRAKWVVSSRNWPEIEDKLEMANLKIGLSLELNAQSISAAVESFIQHKVAKLAEQKRYDDRTRTAVLEYLGQNSQDTFLWVSLVVQNLEGVQNRNVIRRLHAIPPGLHALYERMLLQLSNSDDADLCKQMIALAATAYRPVTIHELSVLVEQLEGLSNREVLQIVNMCGSFLTLQDNTVYFVHQSAKDFVLSDMACGIFPSEKEDFHRIIFSQSLRVMSTLHRDMYNLRHPGISIEQVNRPDPDPLAALRYACIHWVDHFCDWTRNSTTEKAHSLLIVDGIEAFLKEKFLYWVEFLSLDQSIPKGVLSMTNLANTTQATTSPTMETVSARIKDAYRFIRYHSSTIKDYPLQTYASALLFSPTGSLTRQSFRNEAPTWVSIKPDVKETWSLCLQTLLHTGPVHSVTFSPDSTQLASTSYSEVKIWNAISGQCLQTLEMDEGILSMAYAHDASRVAVLLGDRSIEIWDATNGKCLSKLDYPEDMRPYPSYISQIKFSIDSKTLAVAHSKVSIWDVESGIYLRTLEAHNDKTTTICFSYDSHWLASVSRDDTIKIWDAHNGNLSKSLVQTDSLQAVFFFRDNIRLASASEFQIVIWNWYSGEVLQVLQTGASVITASLDSEKFASCGESPDTQIWDANSYTPTHTLEGHNDRVNSLSFSHDAQLLASASGDGSVKIWDSSGHGNVQRAERQSLRLVHDVTLSFDSMQVATTGGDSSIQVWDVESGKCTWVLESQTAFVRSIVFSRDNPRQLASLSEDNIKLWNTNTGNCLTTLVPQESKIASISFFDGSRKLLSLSENGVLQIWDTAIGRCVQRHNFRKTDTGRHYIMTLSDDSRFLAIAVDNFIIEIWDLRISTCIQTVSYEGFVTAMSFSNGSTYLAAAVHYGHGLVWNMRSGDRLHKFYCESGVDRLFFDATGSFLRTNHGEIDIAASTRESGGQKKKMPRYRGLALERDLSWITYNSEPLLFIPSEYRVTEDRFDVLGNVIVIVDGSNRLWMYTFDLEKLELEIS